jgi:uncharacterized protein (DUF2164 family)
MTKNKESAKLKRILTAMGKEETASPATSILKKIKEREAEDAVKRKEAEKFVEQFTKENGPIKYFQDQWVGTKIWTDAYNEGHKEAEWESEDEHKDIIYKLVKKLTHGQS